ncbi:MULTISPECIES: hypothetical protein [Pantoea]|uniref:hypothetical protein n=1 Tax=Pantoea TaxID=53335 RepID=UPI001F4798D5|nr:MULTISPECIES: hypothetical protein [Pantoea]UIL51023.1 hypothetical protein LZU96_12265 [Pantoea agglomerans]
MKKITVSLITLALLLPAVSFASNGFYPSGHSESHRHEKEKKPGSHDARLKRIDHKKTTQHHDRWDHKNNKHLTRHSDHK